jgi:hypothetical protein
VFVLRRASSIRLDLPSPHQRTGSAWRRNDCQAPQTRCSASPMVVRRRRHHMCGNASSCVRRRRDPSRRHAPLASDSDPEDAHLGSGMAGVSSTCRPWSAPTHPPQLRAYDRAATTPESEISSVNWRTPCRLLRLAVSRLLVVQGIVAAEVGYYNKPPSRTESLRGGHGVEPLPVWPQPRTTTHSSGSADGGRIHLSTVVRRADCPQLCMDLWID